MRRFRWAVVVALLGTLLVAFPAMAAYIITGTQGDDELRGTAERDLIRAFDGEDVLNGFADDDTLVGGDGFDLLVGGRGSDVFIGGKDGDGMRGKVGADAFLPGHGADLVEGGLGRDVIEVRDDSYIDLLRCGPGLDAVVFVNRVDTEDKVDCDWEQLVVETRR